MAVISGILKDPIGGPRVGVVIELRAVRTSATVVNQARSQSITDATGRYTLTVEPGAYDVMITASGRQPERVGGITVYIDSLAGTLNDFLTAPGETDLTPEIVATVDRMRAEAAASAAAAKVSETNAAAAMTNALSKVATADQTVAGAVKFAKTLTSTGVVGVGVLAPETNAILRFYDADSNQQGALYSTTTTGQMTLRWAGTAYSAIFNANGSVTFPGDIYSGSTKIATRATSLGALDLNAVVDEGDYYQSTTANATAARNYPIVAAGVLKVIKSKAQTNNKEAVTQLYYPWHVADTYYSRIYAPSTDTWSVWEIFESRSKNDARYIKVGQFGVGAVPSATVYADKDLVWRTGTLPTPVPDWMFSDAWKVGLHFYTASHQTSPGVQFALGQSPAQPGAYYRYRATGSTDAVPVWAATIRFWDTANTTVDANGFIKKASPIVKLFGDGTSELNEQSQGVTTERVSEGVYRVSGVLGFNSDSAWGGPNGGIGLPKDNNDLALVWVDYEVDESGDLLIKTFHRINSTAPKFAQNVKTGYKEGAPIDIPAGRWIDLRVEMPAGDEPEPIFEPEPVPDPEVVPDTEQQPGAEAEQPAASEQNDTPEAEAKE